MTRSSAALVAVAVLLAVSSCSGVRKQLGYGKQSPDEFRVVSRAPLSLPPEFSLRPPEPGATRPQEGSPTEQARRAVFRVENQDSVAEIQEAMPNDGRSLGERAFLVRAGADQVEPDIRLIVDRETDRINDESEDFIETLVFWRESEPQGDVVDAGAESKRLQEKTALGRPITEGKTPTVERKKKALLEGIF